MSTDSRFGRGIDLSAKIDDFRTPFSVRSVLTLDFDFVILVWLCFFFIRHEIRKFSAWIALPRVFAFEPRVPLGTF